MKSVVSAVILLAIVIGGVFALTFAKQYTKTDENSAAQVTAPVRKTFLECKEVKADWDSVLNMPPGASYKLEVEKGVKGHYDFLVKSENAKPISATVKINFNCTCLTPSVQTALLAPEQRAKLKSLEKTPAGPQIEPFLAGAQWHPVYHDLKNPSPSFTIPPAEGDVPQYLVVRIGWDTKDYKSTYIRADLEAQMGLVSDGFTFEVPLTVTIPVLASQQEVQLGSITTGQKREADVVFWSPTRDKFPASVGLATEDPCIELSTPRPLTPDELQRLPVELLNSKTMQVWSRAKSGYVVHVTVNESKGDNQLELGPLSRKFILNRSTDTENTVVLHATVRGSIKVGDAGDPDRVDLGTFNAGHGVEKHVGITSPDPSLQLVLDHVKPDNLEVKLEDAKAGPGVRRWKLNVFAPPNIFGGPLPGDAAIYLKTVTTPPRRIRIPVLGNASG